MSPYSILRCVQTPKKAEGETLCPNRGKEREHPDPIPKGYLDTPAPLVGSRSVARFVVAKVLGLVAVGDVVLSTALVRPQKPTLPDLSETPVHTLISRGAKSYKRGPRIEQPLFRQKKCHM